MNFWVYLDITLCLVQLNNQYVNQSLTFAL